MAKLPEKLTHTYRDRGLVTIEMELAGQTEFEVRYRIVRVTLDLDDVYEPEDRGDWKTCDYDFGDGDRCEAFVFDDDEGRCWDHEEDEYGVLRSRCECYGGADALTDPPEVCAQHWAAYRARARAVELERWVDPSPESGLF